MDATTLNASAVADNSARTQELFQELHQRVICHTDRLFARLMVFQWIAGIAAAILISPRSWTGTQSQLNAHVIAAVLLGAIITILPVYLALTQPGKAATRHTIAVGQMLMSALLIHLTGGRIETHFHVFGSLAILAFYRDWRVLISASMIVYVDHLLRGIFWPQSVYGVLSAPMWRSLEHVGWVIFEVTFLIISIRKSLGEMLNVAERQARLEAIKGIIERTVEERTEALRKEVAEKCQAQENLQRSEERLRHSQKMEAVGRLAGGVAHDFNNLLTVIKGYCGLSLHKMSDEDPLRKHLEEIERAAERAASLTSQLLAFSRKQVLKLRTVSLNKVVAGMEKMLRPIIGEDITLCTALEAELGSVKADLGQIEQVILNMALNARDAMPRGGKLTIQTANVEFSEKLAFRDQEMEPGRYVVLRIADTGVGMTDEVQAHIFEPFFTTKGLGRGTGLGLATCYGIICQSGGNIRVQSQPNGGTTFEIFLPRIEPVPDAMIKTQPEELLPRGTESVLVVEDEGAVRQLATSVLRDRGYQVREARNGTEALALIRGGSPFDLVLTDVVMPRMSGRDLYNQIRVIDPAIRVLFMSGYTGDTLAPHGVLEAGVSLLEKPFTPGGLAQKVRQTIDRDAVDAAG